MPPTKLLAPPITTYLKGLHRIGPWDFVTPWSLESGTSGCELSTKSSHVGIGVAVLMSAGLPTRPPTVCVL